jgi:hypothetical protein
MLALFHHLDELGPNKLCPPRDDAILRSSEVQALHQMIDAIRDRVHELAIESGSANQTPELFPIQFPYVEHGNGVNA